MLREFLQLAHIYCEGDWVSDWFWSEKLDGMRCFWDGGVSVGMRDTEVPWANVDKRSGFTCTGLWSRYGHVICAPEKFTENLPRGVCLDGELWLGRGRFQELMSIVKDHNPGPGWKGVSYRVFDCPSYKEVFGSGGRINGTLYKKDLGGCATWLSERGVDLGVGVEFWKRLSTLRSLGVDAISYQSIDSEKEIDSIVSGVVSGGGEGIMLRHPTAYWEPCRSRYLLKVKPLMFGSGVVVGVKAGKGKLFGMMGSVEVRGDNGVLVSVSGFTDEERLRADWLGKRIRYKYRDVTDSGIPKEARHARE